MIPNGKSVMLSEPNNPMPDEFKRCRNTVKKGKKFTNIGLA